MKTGISERERDYSLESIHFFGFFLYSTESGLGSDIFDVGATDYSRHPSTIERVGMICHTIEKSHVRFLRRHFPNELLISMKKPTMILCLIIEVGHIFIEFLL